MGHSPVGASHAIDVGHDFPGENVCLIDVRTDMDRPEVHFTPSPKGGPEPTWFHFRITPRTAGPHVRCVLHFVENLLGGNITKGAFHPVIKTSRRGWGRVATIERQQLPDGQGRFAWDVPGDEGAVDVALCYPYGMDELEALIADTGRAFARDAIGATPHGRLIPRLSNSYGTVEPAADKPHGIYCIARQHAGETPGSLMLDGFLRHIAAVGPAALLVWAVPFADLDGVIEGAYGKDSFPWDFNRAWGSKRFPRELHHERGTHPMRHEVKCIQHDLVRWRDRCRPMVVLDFHAPTLHETGIYCYLREVSPNGQPDAAHAPWIDAIRAALDPQTLADPFVRSGRYPSRWNTARVGDFVIEALQIAQVTVEVTYMSRGDLIFTRDVYLQAGERLARAIIDVRNRPAASGESTDL